MLLTDVQKAALPDIIPSGYKNCTKVSQKKVLIFLLTDGATSALTDVETWPVKTKRFGRAMLIISRDSLTWSLVLYTECQKRRQLVDIFMILCHDKG